MTNENNAQQEIAGVTIHMFGSSRIPHALRVESLYYYEVSKYQSFDTPNLIQKRVVKNFYGTIVTETPIESLEDPQGVHLLEREEIELLKDLKLMERRKEREAKSNKKTVEEAQR